MTGASGRGPAPRDVSPPDVSPPDVSTSVCDGTFTVRLDRPAVRNALRQQTWRELDAALDAAETDRRVRVVVLTGGDEWFSSGADLRDGAVRDSAELADLWVMTTRLRTAQHFMDRLRRFPKPTLAAVEGYAIGIAWPLVLSCDLIVAARGAYFAQPPASRGMIADGGLARLLCESAGVRRATEILLTRDRVTAQEAHGFGLVTLLSEPGGAVAAAAELARGMASRPASVQFLNKALLVSATADGREANLEHERTAAALNRLQQPNIEGRRQFLDGGREHDLD